MIQVTVFVNTGTNHFAGFHTYGHAEYAEEGYDIICSAVSAIILTTINSIEELTQTEFLVTQDQQQGEIDFRFKTIPEESAELLLRSMIIGLKGISEEYGIQYLKVNTKEV